MLAGPAREGLATAAVAGAPAASRGAASGHLTASVYGLIKENKYAVVARVLEPYYNVRAGGGGG